VFRDGVLTPIIDSRIAARYDADFHQTGADAEIIDGAGHVTRVTMERFAFFSFEAGERTLLNEAACIGTIDGADAVAHLECGWESEYAATQANRTTHWAGKGGDGASAARCRRPGEQPSY
jgi:hypothetical protein